MDRGRHRAEGRSPGMTRLLSFLSPCVLPLVPSYLVYIAGVSFGELQDRCNPAVRLVVVLNALRFILTLPATTQTPGQGMLMLGASCRT